MVMVMPRYRSPLAAEVDLQGQGQDQGRLAEGTHKEE